MAEQGIRSGEHKNIGYEMFIALLSILSILNLVLSLMFKEDQNLQAIVVLISAVLTPIFCGDFLHRLFSATSKPGYVLRDFGWADLLSSLPLPELKILRMFRLRRVIWAVGTYGFRNLGREIIENGAGNAMLTVTFLVFCLLEFGSLAVLRVEQSSPSANIKNASDALWWIFVSITTVGYGDRYPVTNAGRVVGIFVLTTGVGLFGTLSGFLANTFLAERQRQKERAAPRAPAAEPEEKLAEIQRMLKAQEEALADLKTKLEEVGKVTWRG